MSKPDVMASLQEFKQKIEEAVSLVPGMSAEAKLKAVQFWNLVSERLQDIVNNSAADINALAMRMEEEKQAAQEKNCSLPTISNMSEAKSIESSEIPGDAELAFDDSSLLQEPPNNVIPNYAMNSSDKIMQDISQLEVIQQNVTGLQPETYDNRLQGADKAQSIIQHQQGTNVICGVEQKTRRNVIQTTPKSSQSKSDVPPFGCTKDTNVFLETNSEAGRSSAFDSETSKPLKENNALSLTLDEASENSMSAESMGFLSNESSCEASKSAAEEKKHNCNADGEASKSSDCEVCSKTTVSQSSPSGHQCAHSKPYSCTECDAKFSTKGNLLVHQRRHTGEKPFGCEKCPASFSTKGNLKRHIKAHTGERPWQCTLCNSKFTEKKSLKVHMRRHTGEKPYKCSICAKSFSQTGVLQTHMALHLDERKHLCEMCGKAFRQRSQLRLHVLRHEGVKRWNCPDCSAKFLTKGDLERHYRVHTGERPFVCDLCGKTFTRQQSLNEHSNRHYGLKPYSCNICNKKFAEMSACYKHIKVHKKMEAQVNISGSNGNASKQTNLRNETGASQEESSSHVNVIQPPSSENSSGLTVFIDFKQLSLQQSDSSAAAKETSCSSMQDLDLTAINILANASTFQQTF